MLASSSLAAKLRAEGNATGSRGATPEITQPSSNRSTPPKSTNLSPRLAARGRASKSPTPERATGLKRKAEDEIIGQRDQEGTETPPLKKAVIQSMA